MEIKRKMFQKAAATFELRKKGGGGWPPINIGSAGTNRTLRRGMDKALLVLEVITRRQFGQE